VIRAGVLAGFSALLGGAIALAARRRPSILERTRTFAFAAAAGVVAFHLLPDVLPSQGPVALLWMAAGFALPWMLEAAARKLGPGLLHGRGLSGFRVSAEVGFAALLFHSVVEGLALVAALAQPRGNVDLEIALVAHHAPLTAAVVLPFLDLGGPRSAAIRAAIVAAAGIAGALLSLVLPGFREGAFLQTAVAVTAGALLHVVSDEICAQRFDSPAERVLDLAACAAGLLVAGIGALLHLRDGLEAASLDLFRLFGGLALACAPAVIFGSVACALLASRTRFFRWDAFLLLLVLLGAPVAMAWAALTVLLSLPAAPSFRVAGENRPVGGELVAAVGARGPAMLALLVAAAALELSSSAFPASRIPGGTLLLLLVLCARLDEAGAVAVAAVLVHKGLDPGLAVGLLALGPATRLPLVPTAGARGRMLAAVVLAVEGAVALAAGRLLSLWGVLAGAHAVADQILRPARAALSAQVLASPLGAVSALVLVAVALATLWSTGARGWFAPLRHGPRPV
jgi:zinc transporter ZupT